MQRAVLEGLTGHRDLGLQFQIVTGPVTADKMSSKTCTDLFL